MHHKTYAKNVYPNTVARCEFFSDESGKFSEYLLHLCELRDIICLGPPALVELVFINVT